jgi:hypothetical protein
MHYQHTNVIQIMITVYRLLQLLLSKNSKPVT